MIASLLLTALSLPAQEPGRADWMLYERDYHAGVRIDQKVDGPHIHLENGLLRRSWKLSPNAACYAFDNLMTGASMLRAVQPEAKVTVGGQEIAVGGLVGQPNHAFLTEEWLQQMELDPKAMRFVGYEIGEPVERLAWPRVRHHAPDVEWPPKGISLRFDFEPGESVARELMLHSDYGRGLLDSDDFSELRDVWTLVTSLGDDSLLQNEGKVGQMQIPANHAAYLERAAPEGTAMVQAQIHPGTDVSASWGPGLAVVFEDRVIKFNLRPGKSGFGLWDGQQERVLDGNHDMSHPWWLRIYLEKDRIVCAARPYVSSHPGAAWETIFELPATDAAPTLLRFGKMDKAGGAIALADAGPVGRCKFDGVSVRTALNASMLDEVAQNDPRQGLRVSVYYEMYDGIPLLGKRVVVRNAGKEALELDHLTTEVLSVVESVNFVEKREDAVIPQPEHFYVETDYAFGGMNPENAQSQIVHWRPDPDFHTQVNYLKQTPCLLEVEPLHGPDVMIAPGEELASWWTFELGFDSTDRERRSLAQRRMYRTLAPWATENPLILHVVSVDEQVVKRAIDQAAECGFEMLSLSFGSGLNMEDESAANHAKFKDFADYAMERGIHIGGYSLLASRRIQPDTDNAINVETGKPGGQTFGYAPALASAWGQSYFRKLYAFFENTGFLQFTHDGSYPGDWDAAERLPLQRGYEDSQWVQWNIICEYYRWLRERGAYLRVPDFYYLQGANECGMGYREVNWSLPRAQQVIHTRQNIFDGTWIKTPSMGWMFVPLTQYHGGGAAATIEPLEEHIDHYERMLASNLGLGVQAVYRGHRLYDTERVRDAVKRWVDWFKHYRDILESDVLHLRRADGRDVDYMLHVNPKLDVPGMLVVYNPLDGDVERKLTVPLYLTGLDGQVLAEENSGPAMDARRRTLVNVARDYTVELDVFVPAGGMTWVSFQRP